MPTAGATNPPEDSGAYAAKAAIGELITRYVALLDAGDWEELAALYTEDGRMNRPTAPEEFTCGRAAILASFKARPRRIARHIVANILVTVESADRAQARSQILLFGGSAAADGGLPYQSATPPLIGSYLDTLVRTAHGWRFTERCGTLDFRAAPP